MSSTSVAKTFQMQQYYIGAFLIRTLPTPLSMPSLLLWTLHCKGEHCIRKYIVHFISIWVISAAEWGLCGELLTWSSWDQWVRQTFRRQVSTCVTTQHPEQPRATQNYPEPPRTTQSPPEALRSNNRHTQTKWNRLSHVWIGLQTEMAK